MAKKAPKRRLDAELVRRKIARSREAAVDMIKAGRVEVGGFVASKPATAVTGDVSIRVSGLEEDENWASRGAHKLLGALEAFEPQGLDLKGRKVLDAGASTGGFTDVCLRRDVETVYAVDVGYGQLIWRLQDDPRVVVLDRTNVRTLTPEILGGTADVMVGDLSFISLKLVLPAIVSCLDEGADLLPMVKPQFEVGKERLGSGGVVRSDALRQEVVQEVAEYARTLGLSFRAAVASPLPGSSGNVEFFLWLVNDGGASDIGDEAMAAAIAKAVEEGPHND
ncbi:16S/23S rRNA (cytidine-2'-O)-methyltransferase [Corynebacterium sp. LK29]|uniref:TlyA family RNA methyltransferase n=1 Tax=Corynebacterium sp. LK29 TaxID=2044578 RepID=UPI0016522300|nr:16S/23S rRNA (cytidine-2'-O)-methyltransferase [Corynebacterium sp. LK29]